TEIQMGKDNMEHKLQMYLKHGITTVIDVGSNFHFLKQREDFRNKDSVPSIFITGPLLTTYQPEVYKNHEEDKPFILTKTVEDGIKGVQQQLPFKPDFIKIWYITGADGRSEEHTSELQSRENLVCRLLLEKKNS